MSADGKNENEVPVDRKNESEVPVDQVAAAAAAVHLILQPPHSQDKYVHTRFISQCSTCSHIIIHYTQRVTTPAGTPAVSQAVAIRLRTLAFVDATPDFVPKSSGRRQAKCILTPSGHFILQTHTHMCTRTPITTYIGVLVGKRIHSRVRTKDLMSGPSSRRGKPIVLRGHCVHCLSIAKRVNGIPKLPNGKSVPYVTYACDVCRVHLCSSCFKFVYDHRKGGKPPESVILK